MILKGSQRAGAAQLARHLQRIDDNDHVEVHELRGFAGTTLMSALQEIRAVAQGTRCLQYMFSLSLNPPETETVPVKVFEQAIERIEEKLGLSGRARAIVFHEKEGRRHAHCVWSRIDPETMTAINLPHYKRKLQDISKQLYLEHGWRLPAGLIDAQHKDPTTFTRAEWQQALRAGRDPRVVKALFRECWVACADKKALQESLHARGFVLAKGDRRGVVAVDWRGEVYALAKWAGVKSKEVSARLGKPDDLPGISQAREQIAARMTPVLQGYVREVEAARKIRMASLAMKKAQMKERHLAEREKLSEAHARRWAGEAAERAGRFRKGIGGMWDWLTGKNRDLHRQNLAEAEAAIRRDDEERDELIQTQLSARRELQDDIKAVRQKHAEERAIIEEDIARTLALGQDQAEERSTPARAHTERTVSRRRGPDRTPQNELER